VRREGGVAALATIVEGESGTPGKVGFRMLVYPDGRTSGTVGGGLLEMKVRGEALQCIHEKKTKLLEFTLDEMSAEGIGMQCGGKVKIFFEPIQAPPKLYVFGGGHIAIPLVQFAKLLDYNVTVIDNREEFANVHRFPMADQVKKGDYAEIIGSLEFHDSDCVVIVTHGHEYDEVVLKNCLSKRSIPGYVGMIGSRNKVATTFSHLKEQGLPSSLLAKVSTPVGLDIGAKSPSEIALSIMAEIVAKRYGKTLRAQITA
jgi:xanthine dehydrogenase accessory factor